MHARLHPSESGYNICKFWSSSENLILKRVQRRAALAPRRLPLRRSACVFERHGEQQRCRETAVRLSSGSVVVQSSSDAYTVTNCNFGTPLVTVGGSTVFNGTLNGVSSLTSVTLRATSATG